MKSAGSCDASRTPSPKKILEPARTRKRKMFLGDTFLQPVNNFISFNKEDMSLKIGRLSCNAPPFVGVGLKYSSDILKAKKISLLFPTCGCNEDGMESGLFPKCNESGESLASS